jgi:dihydropteroate synthase
VVSPVAVWGVVNVTPDSFSDGGAFLSPEHALGHARELFAHGADVVDVGAESTRPGAGRISSTEEIDRLTPVVGGLLADGYRVSVDTMRAETADQMISLGVPIINDVSGGLADPDMFRVIAGSSVDYVLMHWRGPSDRMDDLAHYDSVVTDVSRHLVERIARASEAGVDPGRITIDPGFGFSKTPEHNWELCRGISEIVRLGYPVLAGVSRKRFIGQLLPADHEMADRDAPSAMVGAVLAERGVSALRVHSVESQRRALEIMAHMGGVASE